MYNDTDTSFPDITEDEFNNMDFFELPAIQEAFRRRSWREHIAEQGYQELIDEYDALYPDRIIVDL